MLGVNKEQYIEDVLKKSKRSRSSRDQAAFEAFLRPIIGFLYDRGIYKPPDTIKLFKLNKINNKDLQMLVNSFVSDYNFRQIDPNKKIEWFHKRSFKQIKFELKNYVIIRIIYQYEEYFLDFMHQCNFTQIKDNDKFFKKLDEIIQKIKSQQCYIDENSHEVIITNDITDFTNTINNNNNDDDDDSLKDINENEITDFINTINYDDDNNNSNFFDEYDTFDNYFFQ